jgi:hypothetical protein
MKWLGRLTAAIASLSIGLGLAEVIVRAADLLPDERRVTREHAAGGEESPRNTESRFLQHPFLGYAGNPDYGRSLLSERELGRIFSDGPSDYYRRNSRINSQGFPSEYDEYPRDDGGFDIGIFGGSVGAQLGTIGGETLIAELESRAPALRGRVRVLNLAIGGYKQPQQLINLVLAFLRGVPLDVVVNIDGVNEVTLAHAGMADRYDPVLPSRTHYLSMLQLSSQNLSGTLLERYAEAARLRRSAEEWRRTANEAPWARSELARGVLGRVVVRRSDAAARLEYALQQQGRELGGFFRREPACYTGGRDACWQLVADVWERSSLGMHAIADLIGAQYLHVVQPNQYVEGSKPLSPLERKIAHDPRLFWSQGVTKGYPLLQGRFAGMIARGVELLDLTFVFADVRADVYIDNCCHYNKRGIDMIAAEIAARIRVGPGGQASPARTTPRGDP